MRALVALLAFVVVAALNFLWWWVPNRPVDIAGWSAAPLQSVSFAPYRPGQSPLTRTFPTPDQIEADLKRLQGKVGAVRTYSSGENLETVPQRAGKYGLKVWHGAWLNSNEKENLEQINLLIDHANKYKDTVERVIVGNEVLLRKDLTANELRRYIRQVKQRVTQPVTYADVWEFWLRNPSLADEVDFITIHILPYWEDEPIGLDRTEADGKLSIEKHLVDIYKKVQARFPGKKIVIGETGWPSDGRMRSDARPGRVEQVKYFSIFRGAAEREGFDYNVIEAFDQYWKARQEGTVGAEWGLLDAQRHDKFELGKPVRAEPHWQILFAISTIGGALLLLAYASRRKAGNWKGICLFAFFAQLVATCYVQATWVDVTRNFYFEKTLGIAFWAVLLALFSYALLRGIADSLTGQMADPSLYGARVRESWRAWRELPRYRIAQRADLLAQMLYLVLTILCIFYLIVISIDWYDGVIRIGDWFRQIAIDGRYRDFPMWSFVIPSIVLMLWKTTTILRTDPVARDHRIAKALSFGRLLGYDGSRGVVRMDRRMSRFGPVMPEIVLASLLVFWAIVMVVTEGAIKLHDGSAGGFASADGGRWVIRTLLWNTQANWFAFMALLMAVPYIATIYVSVREPLAELPPDSYTNKW
ncbi:glycoside hydrolase family 17 protein [Reyranella sp.]|uniref:glycoside hydrolase family 17 protein n=1 Tax=Reyranella sp. TaxID=1929291 RepID=UPI0040363B8D